MARNYPFRVGIAGHQSLTEVEKDFVGKEISRTLASIQRTIEAKRKPFGIKCDFFISGITCLAEGADRAFAKEVLNLKGHLEIVLPFKSEIYMQDFWGDESKEEFRALMAFDNYPLVVDGTNNPHKGLAYYKAAKCVIDQCDVLIAVWDETPVKRIAGGTESLIDYAKSSGVPVIVLFPKPNKGNEKENKMSMDAIDLSRYRLFDQSWSTLRIKPEVDAIAAGFRRKLKPIIDKVEFDKLNNCLDAYSLWQYEAQHHERLNKRMLRFTFLLAVASSVLGIFILAVDIFRAHGAGQVLNHGNAAPANDDFYRMFRLLLASFISLEWLLLLVLLLLFLYTALSTAGERYLATGLWAEKMKLNLYKILIHGSDYELISESSGVNLFQSRGNDSRLFMLLAKDARTDFKNSLSFGTRVALLGEELIKAEIKTRDKELTGQPAERKLLSTAGIFWFIFAFISISVWGILYFYKTWYPAVAIPALLPDSVLVGCAVFSLFGLVSTLTHQLKKYENVFTFNKNTRERLMELSYCFPDLCTTEEELRYLFNKTEETILTGNNKWLWLLKTFRFQ